MRFNEFADSYPEKAFIQKQLAQWLSEWVNGQFCSDANVADIGAGTGFLTQRLSQRFKKIQAIDKSPKMLEQGKYYCPRADWSLQDAWSFEAESPMDLISSSSLLQWSPEPQNTLAKWAKSLAPGGRMLHGLFIAPSLPEIMAIDARIIPLQWHSAEKWQEFFTKAGLKILRSEAQSHQFIFSDADALFSFFKKTGASDKNRVRPGHLLHILREYNQRFSCSGGIHSSWTFFRVEAALDSVS